MCIHKDKNRSKKIMDLRNSSKSQKRIILLISLLTLVDGSLWTCSHDGKAVALRAKQIAGIWYEIARFPSSDVPACLELTAPESQVHGNYTLELKYINNFNNNWQPTKESLVFPWSEAKNGNFNLQYSNEFESINVKFIYLGSMKSYTVVCGYTDFASSLSIVRVLSRNKLVNNTVQTEIDALAHHFQIKLPDLTWVQQDGRCNRSHNLSMFSVGVLIIFYLVQSVVLKSNLLT